MFDSLNADKALALTFNFRERNFSGSVSKVFRSLGLNFKYKKGSSFWLTNEAELEYLYKDFERASRGVLKELHPDAGGDAAEFREFAQTVASVKKGFWNKGIGKNLSIFKAKEAEQKLEDRLKNRKIIFDREINYEVKLPRPKYSPIANDDILSVNLNYGNRRGENKLLIDKAFKIAHLLLQGVPVRLICKNVRTNKSFINRVKKGINKPLPTKCHCGKPISHKEWCKHRISLYPRFQNALKNFSSSEVARKFHESNKKPKSLEHKKKISESLRGKKKTEEHIFKIVRNKILNGNNIARQETKEKISRTLKLHFRKKRTRRKD